MSAGDGEALHGKPRDLDLGIELLHERVRENDQAVRGLVVSNHDHEIRLGGVERAIQELLSTSKWMLRTLVGCLLTLVVGLITYILTTHGR